MPLGAIEALNHAKAADVPVVVAVNKVDKYGADPDPRPVKNILKGGGFDTLEGCETDAGGADRGCVTVADPNLRVRRRVFSTTVFLRNRI